MIRYGEKTSTDVHDLLSTIHDQLMLQDHTTLQWRRKIERQLELIQANLFRIENTLRN